MQIFRTSGLRLHHVHYERNYRHISSYNTDGEKTLLNRKCTISYQDAVEGDKPEEHVDICHETLLAYQCTLKSIQLFFN
jgi:hypothetical protein